MVEDDVVVDDLYDGYELTFTNDNTIEVYCTRCEKDVGSMNSEIVRKIEESPLLAKIVELHKEVGVE
jgi:hypothetical protein